jgi:hypothetical protein
MSLMKKWLGILRHARAIGANDMGGSLNTSAQSSFPVTSAGFFYQMSNGRDRTKV